ncbi:MAG: type II toxin-antitoxin system RelE/ParE family toxin [Flavobacteriaceae bacterium]|jgi:plasmid stabilization system protein ParE|nr:type II toxin-antitoxin system RelE/ParE family toxin [Flavobacteriaceae bacterium]
MKYKLFLSDEALWDIQDAFDYYTFIPSENLEHRFIQQIETGLDYITLYPENLAVKYKKTRIYNLMDFPYQIHFRIEKDTVLVFGIFHGKSNPKSWEERLKR